MARSRRELRHGVDIWPGFVDALSTLLLVIIFLLVVFVLGQFFLNQLLQGKDTKLASLEGAIAQLTQQLDLEEATTAELRMSVAQLSSDLQSALVDRDDTAAQLAQTEAERDDFRDQLFLAQDEKTALNQTLNELRQEAGRADDLQAELERTTDLRAKLEEELQKAQQTVVTDKATIEAQLAQLIQLKRDIEALQGTRHELELQVAEMTSLLQAAETAKGDATKEIARLADLIEAAQAKTATLESQVTDLQQSVGSAEQESRNLADEVTRLTALLQSAREESAAAGQQVETLTAQLQSSREESTAAGQQVATLTTKLESAEGQRSELSDEVARLNQLLSAARSDNEQRAQRAQELTTQLESAADEAAERERRVAELAALLQETREKRGESAASAEELQKAREQLLLDLSQVRDRASELEARVASEAERTTLAQREVADRDRRIEDLLRNTGRMEEALATEQTLSREALTQVEILNRQINALRVQLASLDQSLELEQQKVEEQQVTITDLGSKLNMALAGKVEELSRFRSEFFGRLRQLLGDRPDVQIVGDRFVFQSEVLFPTASADIEPGGRDELRKLAESLRVISSEIPSELPWVLQINGHTDRRPISTPEFPSNWELSTARAINVGKFLIGEGIPPERIAVAGFASFQPLDDRRDEIAYRRNRRIEIKLTTR